MLFYFFAVSQVVRLRFDSCNEKTLLKLWKNYTNSYTNSLSDSAIFGGGHIFKLVSKYQPNVDPLINPQK